MLRAVRLYAVIFLATGAVFGLITGLLKGDAGLGVSAGIFFGLLMSLVLGTMNLVGNRRSGSTQRSLGPRQEVELFVSADLAAAGECAHTALVLLPATVIAASDTALQARTEISWRSFGEVVTVELTPAAGGTHVRVSSRPKVPTTLVDYGSGRRRVDAVVAALRSTFPVS